jgi:hypothetical protein
VTSQRLDSAVQPSQPFILPIHSRPNSTGPSSSQTLSSSADDPNGLKALVMGMSSSQLRENLALLGKVRLLRMLTGKVS